MIFMDETGIKKLRDTFTRRGVADFYLLAYFFPPLMT